MIRFSQKIVIIILALLVFILIGVEIRDRITYKYNDREDSISSVERKVYQDEDFTFSYPDTMIFERGSGLGGGYLIPSVLKVSLPPNAFKLEKTNFSEAYFVIGQSKKSENLADCISFKDTESSAGGDNTIGNRKIGGIIFKSKNVVGAAAGNLYQTRLYRTQRGDSCYEIALTVHTGNISNYPEGTVTEFDSEKAFFPLEKIVDSFKFLN